jgi:hypothetical protein
MTNPEPHPPTASTNGVYVGPKLPDDVVLQVMKASEEMDKERATGYPMSDRCTCGPQLDRSRARAHRYGGPHCRRYRRRAA